MLRLLGKARRFGAMGQIDKELLFEQKFTDKFAFQSKFEKIKCFRVIDEEGKVVNDGGYHKLISNDKLVKMFETMVLINEADQIFNSAQRQARISFYMT